MKFLNGNNVLCNAYGILPHISESKTSFILVFHQTSMQHISSEFFDGFLNILTTYKSNMKFLNGNNVLCNANGILPHFSESITSFYWLNYGHFSISPNFHAAH